MGRRSTRLATENNHQQYVLDAEETASLQSAPPRNTRFPCFVHDVLEHTENCTTASGAVKYFMSVEKLFLHMKTAHQLVYKMEAAKPAVLKKPAVKAKKAKPAPQPVEEDDAEDEDCDIDALVDDMDQLNTDSDGDIDDDDSSVSSAATAPSPPKIAKSNTKTSGKAVSKPKADPVAAPLPPVPTKDKVKAKAKAVAPPVDVVTKKSKVGTTKKV